MKLLICIRHVSFETLEATEDFIGIYETGSTPAEVITKIIKDALCRLGFDLSNCQGQV